MRRWIRVAWVVSFCLGMAVFLVLPIAFHFAGATFEPQVELFVLLSIVIPIGLTVLSIVVRRLRLDDHFALRSKSNTAEGPFAPPPPSPLSPPLPPPEPLTPPEAIGPS